MRHLGQRRLVGVIDDAPEPDIAVAHGDIDENRIELVLIQEDLRKFVADLPIPGGAGFMMLDDGVGKPVQQVGAADDTGQPAVLEHGDAFDVTAL